MYGKIRSIEEILDWCLKALDVKSNRKPIQRYKKNINQNLTEGTLIYNDLIEDILDSLAIENDDREYFKDTLENFIEIYKYFTAYVESYYTSQEQIDFLVAKDMFIPFFALFSSLLFNKYLMRIKQIKPDENKKSFQKFLEWSERNICQQDIKKYLKNKYKQDDSYTKNYDSIRKSIDGWLDTKEEKVPKKDHFEKIVKYLQDCERIPPFLLSNLALFAKLFQEIHKELAKTFNNQEIELLIEHYYFLLECYLKQHTSRNMEETEYLIYSELLNHINPKIINRNHYFDDYFSWIPKLINRNYLTPHKLVRNLLEKRNIAFYRLPEKECMKYIEVTLPMHYFNRTKPQNEYFKLMMEFGSKIDEFEKYMRKEDIKLQIKLFENLYTEKEKNLDDKMKCDEIFQRLKDEFAKNDEDPNISFLKTKYYIFANNPKKALDCCRQCVELGNGKLGEHFKEAVMTGILLSAKNDSKRNYDFFRKTALKYNTIFCGRLKIPAYGRGGKLVDIPEDKSGFKKLNNEYDKYFKNKFMKGRGVGSVRNSVST